MNNLIILALGLTFVGIIALLMIVPFTNQQPTAVSNRHSFSERLYSFPRTTPITFRPHEDEASDLGSENIIKWDLQNARHHYPYSQAALFRGPTALAPVKFNASSPHLDAIPQCSTYFKRSALINGIDTD